MIKPKKNMMLGELLVSSEVITPDQLNTALQNQKESGKRLGQILVDMKIVTPDVIAETLSHQLGIPHLWLRPGLIDPQVVNIIPKEKAKLYQVIPMFKVYHNLALAMSDPYAMNVIEDLEKVTGCSIQPVLCRSSDIKEFIDQYYDEKMGIDTLLDSFEESSSVQVVEDSSDGDRDEIKQLAEGSPIINLVNLIMTKAIRDGASDIHIEPDLNKIRVRYRIDGIMHETMTSKKEVLPAIISRIKVMAKLDIAERRMPQEGRIHIRGEGRDVDLRVSSMPTISGEKIVMRILDRKNTIFDLSKLGFTGRTLEVFRDMLHRTHGLVLVTGPTGSGKTTTLYSAINQIISLEKNFITIEDPVEYQLEIINQIQVNERIGLTFAKVLRSILRLDPDIIMVGEIRDKETAEVAIQAALTGHLVLSTLHTNDSCGAVTRLLDMGIEPYLVASSVIGSLAQRLLRMVCPNCKMSYIPPQSLLERAGWQGSRNTVLVKGKGCEKCFDSGFRGRIGIYEMFEINEEIRQAITRNPSTDELSKLREKSGFKSLREEGLRLVRENLTTIEEVTRAIYAEDSQKTIRKIA